MSYFSTDFGMLLFKADTFEQIIGTYFTSDPRWWWNPTTTICSMALSGSWSVMFTFQLIPSCCLLRDKLFKNTIFIKPPSWIRERVAWGRALLLVPRFLVSLNLNYAWNTYSTPWANLFLPEAPYPLSQQRWKYKFASWLELSWVTLLLTLILQQRCLSEPCHSQDLISNYPFYLSYNSYDVI